ncbi:MAG: amidase family protein [Acidimicrobiia bacterium]|nr:amidase family protein [Acidimicrobiia bacterium]
MIGARGAPIPPGSTPLASRAPSCAAGRGLGRPARRWSPTPTCSPSYDFAHRPASHDLGRGAPVNVGVDPRRQRRGRRRAHRPAVLAGDTVVTNAQGVFDRGIAEYVLALLLLFAKDLRTTLDLQAAHEWRHRETERLAGRRLLVVGAGSIGAGRRPPPCRAGPARSRASPARARTDDPDFEAVRGPEALHTALGDADDVVPGAPLTAEHRAVRRPTRSTRCGLVPGSSTSDGAPSWSRPTLLRPRSTPRPPAPRAALDVFDRASPSRPPSAVWDQARVLVSPHMSGDEVGWRRSTCGHQFVAQRAAGGREGEPSSQHVVDKAAARGGANRPRDARRVTPTSPGWAPPMLATLRERAPARPVEVTGTLLDRIERLDGVLNAWCHLDPERSLAEARASEARWHAGTPAGLLDGVPVAVKDIFLDCAAGPHARVRWASMSSQPWDDDATVRGRARRHGAVLLGKTTTPELGWKGVTDAPAYGITRNPWNTDLTPGGSSGGSSAALAAGTVPLALGTDGGGSHSHPRRPSVAVAGIKPDLRARVPYWPVSPYGGLAHARAHGPHGRRRGPACSTCWPSPIHRDVAALAPRRRRLHRAGSPTASPGLRIAFSPTLGYVSTSTPRSPQLVDAGGRRQLEDAGRPRRARPTPDFDGPGGRSSRCCGTRAAAGHRGPTPTRQRRRIGPRGCQEICRRRCARSARRVRPGHSSARGRPRQ